MHTEKIFDDRDGETSVAAAPRASSPPASNNPNQAASDFGNSMSPANQVVEAFDEFDPRGSVSGTNFLYKFHALDAFNGFVWVIIVVFYKEYVALIACPV